MEGYDDRPPPSHRPRHCRRWCCWWSRMCCELMWEFIFHLIFWASVTPTRPLFSTVMKNFTPSSPHEDDNEHVEQHCSHNNIMIVNDWGALVSTVRPLSYRVISPLPYFLYPSSNANVHPSQSPQRTKEKWRWWWCHLLVIHECVSEVVNINCIILPSMGPSTCSSNIRGTESWAQANYVEEIVHT